MCGVLSTLASKYYTDIADYNFKLHELLQDQGYKAYMLLSGDHTAFSHEYRALLGDSADLLYDGTVSRSYTINDDHLLLEGLDTIPSYSGSPVFFFFFLMSSHFVGVKEPEFEAFKPSRLDGLSMLTFWNGQYDRQTLVNRYDNGVLQADAYIERIFGQLDRKSYLSNALVVIMADHGEGLGEHGNYSHTCYVYQEDIGIPLLIYDAPEVRYSNLEFAEQQDVAPTVVDRLGLAVPSCWEGTSLLNGAPRPDSFHTTRRHDCWRAVIHKAGDKLYKYLRLSNGDTVQKEELYELASDPLEKTNIMATAEPGLIQQLRDQMNQAFRLSRGRE